MLNTLKTKIIPVINAIAIIVIVIITAVDFWSFNLSYYEQMYDINNTATQLNITAGELEKATTGLLDYLKDERDDLNITVDIENSSEQMFNDKEILHMVDVKVLYQNVLQVRTVAIVLWILASCFLFITLKGDAIYWISRGFVRALQIIGLVLGAIILYATIDFSGFWIRFHHVFFSNDLWILNPQTDRLIVMVPENFFNGLVTRIIITIVAGLAIVLGGLNFWKRQRN